MGNLWLVLLLTICLTEVAHGFCRRGIVCNETTEYCCGLGRHKRCCRNGEVDNTPLIAGAIVGVGLGLVVTGMVIFVCYKRLKRHH